MKKLFITLLFVPAIFYSSANAKDLKLPNTDCSLSHQKYEDANKQYSQSVGTAQTQQKNRMRRIQSKL